MASRVSLGKYSFVHSAHGAIWRGSLADLRADWGNKPARNERSRCEVDVATWGTNCRIDNIHAALLNYKLSYYAEAIAPEI